MVLIAIDLENRVPLLIAVPQDEDGLAARLRSFNIQSPQQYVILAPRGVHLGENPLGIANDLSGLKSPNTVEKLHFYSQSKNFRLIGSHLDFLSEGAVNFQKF